MRTRVLGSSGIEVSQLALGTMMFGAWGNPDRRRVPEDGGDRSRCRHHAVRHRRHLRLRRLGSDARGGVARPPRARGGGHQVRQRDGRRSPPSRRIAPMGARGGHRQLAPARHRPHRPVPDAPTRPRHPVRGDARRARPTRARRAGRCRRHVDLSRRATRRGAVGVSAVGPGAARHRAAAVLDPVPRRSSAPCSPCAAATTWVHSCGRHSTAVG